MEIDGQPRYEMVGRGSRAGESVYGVMLFTDTGYILISASFDPAKYPDQLPAFRAMAKSLVMH